MTSSGKRRLLCDCGGTMRLDSKALGSETIHHELCRRERDRFEAAIAAGQPCLVACTQEAPTFAAVRDERAPDLPLTFVNIRERAGWSDEGPRATPKIAALLAEAALDRSEPPVVSMTSAGTTLVYGRDEAAVAAAEKLADRVDVTLVLTGEQEVMPPRLMRFPVYRGRIGNAAGHLGAFSVTVDGHAEAEPSARGCLAFGPGADGVTAECDLILDLTGKARLFPAPDKRDGYFRPDPGNPAAVAEAMFDLVNLVGAFDKPRYVAYDASICTHGRSRKTGCTRCLDLCPTGAIAPQGDRVAFDPHACAGCGSCAAVCPTGAAAYTLPKRDALLARLRTLLVTYRDHGGRDPVLLVHDPREGEELVFAVGRYGRGLPANVIPFAVNSVGQLSLDALLTALAYGAGRIIVLTGRADTDSRAGLDQQVALAETILSGLGYGAERVLMIDEADPFALEEQLYRLAAVDGLAPGAFHPLGGKRTVERMALDYLHTNAPAPVSMLDLPAGAPYGTVEIDKSGCTLCLACVGACPTGALTDDPERPFLGFIEEKCVQCGLCRATCPENVITLKPRLDFEPEARAVRPLNEEEPFACIRCGKPFGVRASVERVLERMQDHAMFQNPAALDRIRMCGDCRVRAEFDADNPMAGRRRPMPRTTDDYLAERKARGDPAEGES